MIWTPSLSLNEMPATSSKTCACRKSDSAILVVKAAEDRLRCDDAEVLNRPMKWGILVQQAMNARFIIIRGILAQDPAQVRLPEHDHVVETFPSDRADQPPDVWVLPRRPGAVGLSRIPMARKRCLKIGPYAVSRSRIR